jgi:hypothetical protein
VCPTIGDQCLRLGRAGVAADHCGATQLVGAQHRHLTGVRVGRPRFGETVVPVVPHHHQSEPVDRCEHRAAGADDHPRLATQHRQPAPVSRRRPEAGGQGDHCRGVDPRRDRLPQRVDIALIRHDGQHTVATAHRRGRRLGQAVAPAVAG